MSADRHSLCIDIHDTSGRDKVDKGMQNWRGKECRVKNHWRDGQRIGIEFNLLWLEFQNTRWLMHCLWRRSKSPMQSNLPSFSPPPRLVYHHRISILPNSPLRVPLYQPPSLRGQCKFILSCIKRCEASHSSWPTATSLSPDISLFPLISRSLASNDIYAILIEYLLYMRLHIQAFSLLLPSTIPHTLASLQCLWRWPKICGPFCVARQAIPVVACGNESYDRLMINLYTQIVIKHA